MVYSQRERKVLELNGVFFFAKRGGLHPIPDIRRMVTNLETSCPSEYFFAIALPGVAA